MTLPLRRAFVSASWLLVAFGLALAWWVRDQPWQPAVAGGLLRLDALSAFFMLLTLVGLWLLVSEAAHPLQAIFIALPLLVAYSATSVLLLCAGYLVSASADAVAAGRPRSPVGLAMALLPALLLTAGVLVLGIWAGAWRYDGAEAGGALNSWTFGLVLLAAVLGSQPLLRDSVPHWLWQGSAPLRRRQIVAASTLGPSTRWGGAELWALAWLYPLLRLYSLGPWNAGWSFAALLLGCAIALWCARLAADAAPVSSASAVGGSLVGLALACAGLSSAAGVAACCMALLCALVSGAGLSARWQLPPWLEATSIWLLSGALPITLPFVVVWLGIGAAAAGGVLLAAGAFWLVGMGNALAALRLLAAQRVEAPPLGTEAAPLRSLFSRRSLAATASLLLDIVAPALVQWPILPVARQLQGGLSPYGDLAVWPWVGLATVDAGRQQVAVLPSLAVAGLMLVLCALAWLVSRLLVGPNR